MERIVHSSSEQYKRAVMYGMPTDVVSSYARDFMLESTDENTADIIGEKPLMLTVNYFWGPTYPLKQRPVTVTNLEIVSTMIRMWQKTNPEIQLWVLI